MNSTNNYRMNLFSLLLASIMILLIDSSQKAQAQVFINADTIINSTVSQLVIVGQGGHGGVTNPTVDIATGANLQADIYTFNNTTLNVTDGAINAYIIAVNTSTVNVSGGAIKYLTSYDDAIVNMTNGTVSTYLNTIGRSTMTLSGGVVTSNVYTNNNSTFNLRGGSSNNLYLYNASVFNLYGSNLTSTLIGSNVTSSGALNLGDSFSQYALDGTLLDGTSLTGKSLFVANGSSGSFHLFSSVSAPEPTSIILFTVGGIGLLGNRKRRKDQTT
jgi:hypothetical protein